VVISTNCHDRAAAITQSGGYVDVKEFYNYLLNRISVQFQGRNIPNAEDSSFSLYLSKLMSYDQFAVKVAEKLNVDPTHLRFTTVNATNGRPKTYVKRLPNVTLGGILSLTYNAYAPTQNQRNDALYYEILEMSLSELEMRKNIKITWLSDGLTREVSTPIPTVL
jgi:ubiquitin carboxyl-terminal hydrolase 7